MANAKEKYRTTIKSLESDDKTILKESSNGAVVTIDWNDNQGEFRITQDMYKSIMNKLVTYISVCVAEKINENGKTYSKEEFFDRTQRIIKQCKD